MELAQLASRSKHSVFVAQCRSSVTANCRPRAASVSFSEIRQSKRIGSTPYQYGSSAETLVLPGRQRLVKCESLQEGQVESVQDATTFASRMEGGIEPRQSGGLDDGLGRAKLAVFVSGGGSNFRAIHAGCKKNAIHGDVAFVVSDKPGNLLSPCQYLTEPRWIAWMALLSFA